MRDPGDPLPSWLAEPLDPAEADALSAAGAIAVLVRCGAVQAEAAQRLRELDAAHDMESLALARLRAAETHAAWERLLPELEALRERLTPRPPPGPSGPPAPEAHDRTT